MWILISILVISTVTFVDRAPYHETSFYAQMDQRLDSLQETFRISESLSDFRVGWAKVNITPQKAVPLAGYGARDPKRMQGVQDSSFVRTVVFKKGDQKAAFITADLLIIHPEVSRKVYADLPPGWAADEIYFAATHTHSGMGAWAPGVVGRLFSGEYDPEIVSFLSGRILASLGQANKVLQKGGISYGDMDVSELVRNRMVKEGRIDSALRMLVLQKDSLYGVINFYSAHATCLSYDFHKLSGDYPARLNEVLEADSMIEFAAYGAAAVGSMGPKAENNSGLACADFIAENLQDQINMFLLMTNRTTHKPPFVSSFRLKLPLRSPYFKLSRHLAIRPYLFRLAFGDYQNYLSVLLLGKTILIGMPCDFSGELAVPLYERARSMGFNLIITSFNGGYMGYVIKDEWYDLPNYEARTMSWYGPDTGSYLSEIISRLLDAINEPGGATEQQKTHFDEVM